MSNMENQKPSFDLFGKPDSDDLKEHLEKGSYQWTNKYTKFLAGAVVVVGLLSVGAWYGHHAATSTSTTTLNGLSALRSQFGNGSGRANSGTQSTGGFSGGSFGGFGGVRGTGTISKVNGDQVTVKLDDPTQAASLKSGDAARVTDTGASAGGQAVSPQSNNSNKSSTSIKSPTSSASAKPSIGGGTQIGGGRRGFFSDPTVQACLKDNGVTLTPGVRPDRNDPKVMAAFAKCLPNFGQGGGTRPSPAPSN